MGGHRLFQPRDRAGAQPEFSHVGGLAGLNLLQRALQPPLLDGELGTQMILLGIQFGERQREQGLHATPRQSLRTPVDGRQQRQGEESCR